MRKKSPNRFWYGITRLASWFVATFIYRRKVLRNEIKGKKGPFVVIANHQSQYDFVNLIGMTRRHMSFVVSDSFYKTLPFKGIMDSIGVIPKQQFGTTISDIKRMKRTVEDGGILVVYPAGLMCEDGLSTPIPTATYRFLQWLGADVYVARCSGTYFTMPKWTKGMRAGRTYLDVYRLFTHEELAESTESDIRSRAEEALLFDAYREQETLRIKYKKSDRIEGLEHVLYMCPHCRAEFSIATKDKHTLYCRACGYEQTCDEYGFLHHNGAVGQEIRYVSDWSRMIYDRVRQEIIDGSLTELSAGAEIRTVDCEKCKFVPIGRATVSLDAGGFILRGTLHGEETELAVSITNFASLPFKPGRYLEIQQGENIYRCLPDDGRLVMKFINMVKVYYELANTPCEKEA